MQVAAHYISYWKELCRNTSSNYYLVGVLQQITDNCVGGADEDLEMLRACVTELTPEVLPQQQQLQQENEEEDMKEIEGPPLKEHQKQDEWEGLQLFNGHQQSDNTQSLLDHVSSDYVITRGEDEPALLPTDTVDLMGDGVSVVTKSSGAILIESSQLTEGSHELQDVPLSTYESFNRSHDHIDVSQKLVNRTNNPLGVLDKSHEPNQGSHEHVNESHDSLNRSHVHVEQSHEALGGSHDQFIPHEQLTELHLASHDLFSGSHDLFSGSHDLTEPLFDDEEASGMYRHRSLTAASISNTPHISLAATSGPKDNSFEAIPLATGSKKKRIKKTGKKKKKQQSSSVTASIPPPLDVQSPASLATPLEVQPPTPSSAPSSDVQPPSMSTVQEEQSLSSIPAKSECVV